MSVSIISVLKLKLKFGRDVNGNKVLKITRPSFRGFSIQSNCGNLTSAHRLDNEDLKDESTFDVVLKEAKAYVTEYGTPRQLALFKK